MFSYFIQNLINDDRVLQLNEARLLHAKAELKPHNFCELHFSVACLDCCPRNTLFPSRIFMCGIEALSLSTIPKILLVAYLFFT